MTSTVLLKHGKNDGIAVYVPKETILKEMATKIKLSWHFFFDLVQELFYSISQLQSLEMVAQISLLTKSLSLSFFLPMVRTWL
jgi:hypothetical protein